MKPELALGPDLQSNAPVEANPASRFDAAAQSRMEELAAQLRNRTVAAHAIPLTDEDLPCHQVKQHLDDRRD